MAPKAGIIALKSMILVGNIAPEADILASEAVIMAPRKKADEIVPEAGIMGIRFHFSLEVWIIRF